MKNYIIALCFLSCFLGIETASAQTQLLQQSKLIQSYWNFTAWGNFLAGNRYGVHQLDIFDNMNPDNPTLLKQHVLENSLNALESDNHQSLLLGFDQKLTVMNVQNPLTPVETGNISLTGAVTEIASYFPSAYVTTLESNGTYKLNKININNNGEPSLENAATFSNKIGKLQISNDYGFLLETKQNSSILYIYQIQSGNVLNIISLMPFPLPFTGMEITDNTLYLNSMDKMVLYDITNPASISLKKELTIAFVNGFAPINQTQFVLTYANRLEWKDATGNLTTTFQTGEAPISVKVINEKVYYSTTAGTYILTVSALNSIQDLSANLNLKGYPNPAKDNWTLQTSTLPQDSYTLNLVNLNGTIVYTRTEETGQNIEIQPNFPAGLYFYTLVSPSGLIAKGKVFFESATE